MSYLLVFLGILIFVVLVVVVGIITMIRTANPHSRAMMAVQNRINRRAVAAGGVSPSLPAAAPEGDGRLKGALKWAAGSSRNIFVIGIGLTILIGGIISDSPNWQAPTLATIVAWSREHWLWILLLAGTGAIFAEMNADALGRARKAVHRTLLWGLLVLFIGIPILASFTSTDDPAANTRQIPLASSPQSSWPKLTAVAGGKFPHIAVPPKMHVVMIGNNFRLHNVYQDGHECAFGEPCVDGPLLYVYATNEAKETNIISYAFAP